MKILDIPKAPLCFKCKNNIDSKMTRKEYLVKCGAFECEAVMDNSEGFESLSSDGYIYANKIISCECCERRSGHSDRRNNEATH